MVPFFFDSTFILLIPAFILAIYAQAKVKSTYARFAKVPNRRGLTGAQVARDILEMEGIGDVLDRGAGEPATAVAVERVSGHLTDHYDPRDRTLRLSDEIYSSPSIAAIGIAAHEAGHAVQHHHLYLPLHLRNIIYPVANLGSTLAFPLFFIGLIFGGGRMNVLMDIGIILFSGAVAFTVITLPVEFNASRRALALIKEHGYLAGEELEGAKKVLQAAALTYVAATAMAIMQLLRLVLLRNSRD